MVTDLDAVCTVPMGAKMAGVSPGTVRNWVRTGKLAGVKIGRDYLVRRDDLQAVAAASALFTQGKRKGGKAAMARRWNRGKEEGMD